MTALVTTVATEHPNLLKMTITAVALDDVWSAIECAMDRYVETNFAQPEHCRSIHDGGKYWRTVGLVMEGA